MASDVILTSALRNNLLSLQNTQRSIDTTQLRLATGLAVNSALDNPQNFFAAQSLNNRSNDLQRLLDGVGQSIRTIEEADNGISSLTDLVNQADSIATEAQSEIRAAEGFATIRGTTSLNAVTDLVAQTDLDGDESFDISIVGDGVPATATVNIAPAAGETVDNIVANINSNANVNQFIRASVTSGGQLQIQSLEEDAAIRVAAGNATTTADDFAALGLGDFAVQESDGTAAGAREAGTAIAGNIIRSGVSAAPTVGGEFEASADLVTAGFLGAAGDDVDLTLSIDGTVTNVGNVTGADTIQDVVDRINNSGISGVEASFNTTDGRIELDFDDSVGQVELEFSANAASTLSFGFGTGATGAAGAGAIALAAAGDSVSEGVTLVGTSADLEQFEEDFNNIRDQIDGLVEDANFRGINLLGGDDLETFFNEDRDNTLTTEGVDFTALGLGIGEGDFTNAGTIQQSLDDVRAALDDVRNFGQSIANDLAIIQTRRDFTEETINTLTAGADDLTVADQNEEGANLLALQTRQALGTTSLSLAAQSQQSVLSLF